MPGLINKGKCDEQCNLNCSFDRGDCEIPCGELGRLPSWINDGKHDEECKRLFGKDCSENI